MVNQGTIYWTLQEVEDDILDLLTIQAANYLSAEEFARFSRMKFAKRKAEWLLGRITAKQLLTAAPLPFSGQPPASIVIGNHPEGAPYLLPDTLQGCLSISHRLKVAACAYTSSSGMKIGIDLEKIEARENSFVEDFFTPSETDFSNNLSGENLKIWTTLVWSAKEAILKAWQKGLRLDTRSIEIHPVEPGQLQSFPDGWQPLRWKPTIVGYPYCWLGWQKWNDFLLTLAITVPENENPASLFKIDRVHLENFSNLI